MKVKVKKITYEELQLLKPKKDCKPLKPNILWRFLINLISLPDLISTKFKINRYGMEKLGKKEQCLVLMNHSSFIDIKMAEKILWPKAFNIVCTYDGFVGKNWLMYQLGCIPTKKFVTDTKLVRDMMYCIKELKTSIIMYPEAGYTFDGCKTTMPNTLGKLVKMLDIPVVTITSYGAFHRQPLYNNLRLRHVKAHCDVKYLLSKEDLANNDEKTLNEIIQKEFDFDQFRWQQETKMVVKEKTRAEGLHRLLYKCPHCLKEDMMKSEGSQIKCDACGVAYELDEIGYLKNITNGNTLIDHIPNWYKWEREEVKKEIINQTYHLDCDCDIFVMVDTYSIYELGKGHITHNLEGFQLVSEDGKLEYKQKAKNSYSINSDYYWYQLGDIVGIGDKSIQYYCFLKGKNVTKVRLAVEEMYKLG